MNIKYITKHPYVICGEFARVLRNVLSDKIYISLLYYGCFGKKISWKEPKTFNEKLQWLKLFDRNPLYSVLVDKYSVKQWVSDKIGSQYIIPTLGVWDSFDDINFNDLPDRFVLKTTHDGGGKGVVLCYDKNSLDRAKTKSILNKSLRRDIFKDTREWPYKNVKRRIIAETMIGDGVNSDLKDYKCFGFNGKCKAMYVASERQKEGAEVRFDYYDENFQHLDIMSAHPMSDKNIPKPQCFEEMKRLTEVITDGIPEARVDFYEVGGKVYFGEITFFHHGGFVPFYPEKWNTIFGNWIQLPKR